VLLLNREPPGEKMQKAQSIREKSHPMRTRCKIHFLRRKVQLVKRDCTLPTAGQLPGTEQR